MKERKRENWEPFRVPDGYRELSRDTYGTSRNNTVVLSSRQNGTFMKERERKMGTVQGSSKLRETFPGTHMAQADKKPVRVRKNKHKLRLETAN